MTSVIRWMRRELPLLVILFLASVSLLAFALLASEVSEGETHAFDRDLLLVLRTAGNPGIPLGPWWLEIAFRDITSLGGTTIIVLITTLVLGFLLLDRNYPTAILVFVSICGGFLVSTVLKNIIGRPRPDLVSHLVDVQTLSFPSGHATLSAVTYLTLGALLSRNQRKPIIRVFFMAAAIMMTLLIGASRVYLGVHWPTDVLAGWAIGSAWAMFSWSAVSMIAARDITGQPQR